MRRGLAVFIKLLRFKAAVDVKGKCKILFSMLYSTNTNNLNISDTMLKMSSSSIYFNDYNFEAHISLWRHDAVYRIVNGCFHSVDGMQYRTSLTICCVLPGAY